MSKLVPGTRKGSGDGGASTCYTIWHAVEPEDTSVMTHIIALIVGFALDLLFGDPHWLPHPIRWIGHLVSATERLLRRIFGKTPRSERIAGVFLVIVVAGIALASSVLLLKLCAQVSIWLACAVESIICYQMLATKQLKIESMRVYDALKRGTLDEARRAVAMIVGRDTAELDEREVAKAAVETVAENTSDGVVAPLLFMAVFGAPGAVFYKSVNTMDSMVGYKNEAYRYFGTAAARLGDVLSWIPARIAGVLMCLAAAVLRFDARGAWCIFKRDRKAHLSPNSAHTEAACAGALGIQLGGSHRYFGTLVEKPTIGDETRPLELEDIVRANRLLYMTALLGLIACMGLSWCVMVAVEVLA